LTRSSSAIPIRVFMIVGCQVFLLACGLSSASLQATAPSPSPSITRTAQPTRSSSLTAFAPSSILTPTSTPTPFPVRELPTGEYIGFAQIDPSSLGFLGISLLSLQNRVVLPFLPGAWSASVSPDRRRIAFIDQTRLHIIDADNREELLSSSDCRRTTWSPDSAYVLCGGTRFSLLPVSGGEPVPLAPCGKNQEDLNDCIHYDWSPDGFYIASNRASAPGGEFVKLRVDLDLLRLDCQAGWSDCTVGIYGPYEFKSDNCAWLHDSRQLLCNGNDGNLWIFDASSRDWHALPENPCTEWSALAASPSGNQFACDLAAGDGDSSLGLGVVDLDRGDSELVLPGAYNLVDFWLEIP
jgi:hypothetical protein